MASKIQWTEETWNPIVGCTKCSPGCLNCYAERMAARLAHMGQRKYQDVVKGNYNNWFLPQWNGEVFCNEESLDKPLHWRKPRKIFVCSMSDLFHPEVPFEFIGKIFNTMQNAPQHTYLILTKRPKIMEQVFREFLGHLELDRCRMGKIGKNIHLGVTVCTQKEADEKIPILLQIPAAVRFISIEPMLGPIKLNLATECDRNCAEHQEAYCPGTAGLCIMQYQLDWVIVGAESGPKRRECKLEWVQSIVDQCKAANVPVFVKQIHRDGKLVKIPPEFTQEYPQ